ncbi:hypothetical protein EV702DRAFT_1244564 [Suillus placidus]|uniref:Uncharacterized protein n=1 Tax=Suillus placidus TaxID=48579 RepID=A0A9P7A2V5_9AGAM|nr:hypothetical protein EV702DRAFT_1244564 [Suillus placidus]
MSGLPCPPGFNPQAWIQIPESAQVQIWRDTAAHTQPDVPPHESQIDPALLGPNSNGLSWTVQRRVHDVSRDGPHAHMPPMGNEAIPRNTVEQDNTAQSRVRNQQGQPRRGAERSRNQPRERTHSRTDEHSRRRRQDTRSRSPLPCKRNGRRSHRHSRSQCSSSRSSEDSLSRPLSSSVNRTSDPPEMDDSDVSELLRSIREDQLEDRARLDALEGSRTIQPSRRTRPTGAFGRGGAAIVRRRGVYRRAAAQSDDEEATDDEDRTREDITKSKNSLSKTGQDARKYLTDLWYEDKGQMALTVGGDVQDATNIEIFSKAADVTWNEMQKEKDNWPKCLKSRTIHWNKSALVVFAKEMFCGFKAKSKAEMDPQSGNLLAGDGIEQYKVQHDGADPSPFVIPDHMSDEASRPEDEAETYDDWKQRMATAAGFAAETPISHLKFLKVIEPQWRSTQQSRIFDNLHDIWWTTKSSTEHEKFAIRVRGSGRCSTNTDISKVSPYDFGINLRWLNEAQKDRLLEERLKDWGTYGDPVHVEESGAAASEERDADTEGDANAEGDAMTTGGGGEHETNGVGEAGDQ